jgi:hypothetical protein
MKAMSDGDLQDRLRELREAAAKARGPGQRRLLQKLISILERRQASKGELLGDERGLH